MFTIDPMGLPLNCIWTLESDDPDKVHKVLARLSLIMVLPVRTSKNALFAGAPRLAIWPDFIERNNCVAAPVVHAEKLKEPGPDLDAGATYVKHVEPDLIWNFPDGTKGVRLIIWVKR